MIHLDTTHTQQRPDGLRYDPISGVLLAPPSRIERDPNQPRISFPAEQQESLRADIDAWRERGRGLCGTGLMEPLKCRWAPGAFDASGNVSPDAKLILWDGERRWRTTKDDYPWLPLLLDDLNAKDARDAALRTSIHKKLLSRLEEAHAFAQKMADEGWGVPRLAKHYNVSQGYVNNRLPLLAMPAYLQEMVEDDPLTMSHALALHNADLPQDEKKALVEEVEQGLSVVNLKTEIDRAIQARTLQMETASAPDLETAQRTSTFERTGGSNVSRGLQVKGASARESLTEATAALKTASAQIDTAATWFRSIKAEDYEKTIVPEIERIIAKLETFKT